MRRVSFSAFFATIFAVNTASAACFGANAFQNCNDNSSNSYMISRFGDTIIMDEDNAQTGSSWLQSSITLRNITIPNGHASGVNSWNSTDRHLSESRLILDRDSQGTSFSRICNLLDRC